MSTSVRDKLKICFKCYSEKEVARKQKYRVTPITLIRKRIAVPIAKILEHDPMAPLCEGCGSPLPKFVVKGAVVYSRFCENSCSTLFLKNLRATSVYGLDGYILTKPPSVATETLEPVQVQKRSKGKSKTSLVKKRKAMGRSDKVGVPIAAVPTSVATGHRN
jgi:hypothetical protein